MSDTESYPLSVYIRGAAYSLLKISERPDIDDLIEEFEALFVDAMQAIENLELELDAESRGGTA